MQVIQVTQQYTTWILLDTLLEFFECTCWHLQCCCQLHLFFPSEVVSNTVLSFNMPATLWTKTYEGAKVPFQWSLMKTSSPTFRSDALVICLFAAGSILLLSASNLVWIFHIFLAPVLLVTLAGHLCIYNSSVDCLVYLQGGLYHVLSRRVTPGHQLMGMIL